MQNLIVRLGADMSSFAKEMGKVKSEIQNLSSFMENKMAALGSILAGTAITLSVGQAIQDATKVEGAIESVNRLMGESADEFLKWSDTTSQALGISKSEAIDYGRTFSNLTSIFTSSTEETMQTTQDLLKTSAVIASKTGRSMEDVMFRIRSGFLGNTEAVEDLGITVYVNMIEASDAFKRFANGKHWNDLDFRMQQQIRYYAILEQANKKFGTQITDNTGFRILQFTASLKDLRLNLGQAFLPLVYTVLPILTSFVNGLAESLKFIGAFSRALFGVSAAQSSAKSIDTVTNSVKQNTQALGDSKKQMKGYLAGFDEINSMPAPEPATGGGGAGAGITGDPQNMDTSGITQGMEEVNQKAVDMANKVRTAFKGISDFIVEHKTIIVSALTGIVAGFAAVRTGIALTKATGALIGMITSPIFLVGAAIATLLTGFLYFYNTNETFRGVVDSIFTSLGETLSILWNDILVPLGAFLAETFSVAWTGLSTVISSLWNDVLVPLSSFLSETFVIAWNGLKTAMTAVSDFITGTFTAIWTGLKTTYEEHKGVIDTVVGAITLFFLPALIATGVEAGIAGTKIATSFITSLITSGVESTIAASKIAVSFIGTMVASGVEAVKTGAKITTSFIAALIKSGVESAKTAVIVGVNLLKAIIAYGVEGWKTAAAIAAQTAKLIAQGVAWVAQKAAIIASTAVMGLMTAAQWALNVAMDANPIGLIILAIGALVAAGVALYKNWDEVTKFAYDLWDSIKEVGAGIKDVLVGAFEAAWKGIKSFINYIIKGLNFLVDGANLIQFDIPTWVPLLGGKKFGFNLEKIPELAQGGIVSQPTMAMVGEAGKEMIVPLENTSFVDKLAGALGTAVMTAMQMSNGNNNRVDNREVVIKIDGNSIAKAINPYTTKEAGRVGTSILSIS
jgi:hypothetical protein